MIGHLPGGPITTSIGTAALLTPALLLAWWSPPSRPARRRYWLTAGGLATLALAISAPAESLAERTFTAHMLQHLLLLVVAPALLCGGHALTTVTGAANRWGVVRVDRIAMVRRWHRIERGREVALLWAAAAGHLVVVTVWHVPAVFAAAVGSSVVHAIEHVTMLVAGLALFAAWGAFAERAPVATFAASFATAVHGAAVGALITFAATPVFDVADGTTTLRDQQLAGLLMWIPTGLVYTALAIVVVWRAASVSSAPGAWHALPTDR